MELLDSLIGIFQNYTYRNVILGSVILGTVSGFLSVFTVLRKQSLLSEALSHGILPGIGVSFLIMGEKNIFIITIGALLAGLFAAFCIELIKRFTIHKNDVALSVILSTFFGLGVMILAIIQQTGNMNQAGLEGFLLGQAATLVQSEVIAMGILGSIIIGILLLVRKEMKVFAFDEQFGASQGFGIKKLNFVLIFLVVVAVVVGLKMVGAVLMCALLIGPSVAARAWAHQFSLVLFLSCFFGSLAGISGSMLSISELRMATGPLIVLCLFGIVVFSLLFGFKKGIFWKFFPGKNLDRGE